MKLLTCAIVALCVFAQIVRAQYGEHEEKTASQDAKHEDEHKEVVDLDSRYGGEGNRGESWLLNNNLGRKYSRRGGKRNNLNRLLLGGGNGLGSGGLRRVGLGAGGSSRGILNGNGNGVVIQNIGVTNKVVPGYTRVLPTVETNSRERHDVRSQSNSYYRQNSASTVTQNNKRKQTFIHTHLNQVVYHPRHVNHIHKHHHTTYIKQLFPQVTKININQKQKIIEPEKLTIIKYTQDSNFENKIYPTKQRYAVRNQQLQTIRKAVRQLGVRNIGNPLRINDFNGGLRGGGGLGFETGNVGLIRNNNLLGGENLELGLNRQNLGQNALYGKSADLDKRAGEDVKSEEAKSDVEVAVQPVAEAAVDVKSVEAPASNILEQRSASIKAN